MNKTAGVRLDAGELKEAAPSLKAGERVLLSGWVYTARDAAHKQLFALLDNGEPLPFPLDGATADSHDWQGRTQPGGAGSGLPQSGGLSLCAGRCGRFGLPLYCFLRNGGVPGAGL